MASKSKILIIGGTGYIGKFIVEASAKSGHPTFALVRESTVSDPVKGKLIENFKNLGVTLLHVRILNFLSLSLCVFFGSISAVIAQPTITAMCTHGPIINNQLIKNNTSLPIQQYDVSNLLVKH
jgi:nucleoside-diphosphate-sugar epimerase